MIAAVEQCVLIPNRFHTVGAIGQDLDTRGALDELGYNCSEEPQTFPQEVEPYQPDLLETYGLDLLDLQYDDNLEFARATGEENAAERRLEEQQDLHNGKLVFEPVLTSSYPWSDANV